MSLEGRAVLRRMLVHHAYRELDAVRQFSRAYAHAPRDAHDCLRDTIADEVSHYRGCLDAARQLGFEVSYDVQARMQRGPPGIPHIASWEDFVLSHALNDQAGLFVLRNCSDSSAAPYAALCRTIIADEERHGSRGRELLIAHAKARGIERDRLLVHLDASVRCLGRPGTEGDRIAVAEKLKKEPARTIIAAYCDHADAVLSEAGQAVAPLSARYLPAR